MSPLSQAQYELRKHISETEKVLAGIRANLDEVRLDPERMQRIRRCSAELERCLHSARMISNLLGQHIDLVEETRRDFLQEITPAQE